ncbi:MAG: FtsX-like permease family protein, partial [Anaerolineae bacterium]|nr:FtsX-like permease family protein [Anaerolineae bacterium]
FGTSIYAGLGGQREWRLNSYDESYALLNMYDLRVAMAEGSFLPTQELVRTLAGVEGVAEVEPRLVASTLVDASAGDDLLLVDGFLTGVDLSDGGPHINGIHIYDDGSLEPGRNLRAEDAGQPVAVVDYKFASANDVEVGASLRIAGDQTLEIVGLGLSPEYFIFIAGGAFFSDAANYAPVFVSLETAQAILGREGQVNDALLLLEPGADEETVRAAVEGALAAAFPQVGFSFQPREDNLALRALYDDADSDQQVWTSIAFLFLLGAAFGVFNLSARLVASQRRQIGIGMALGVPRFWIAFRPLLVGVQIALLGTLLGLALGVLFSQVFGQQIQAFFPMPVFEATLYWPAFALATALGIGLPLVATLIPVWRAVRVDPVDAISSGYLVAKGGGLMRLAKNLPLPGRSFTQMPIKNLLRAPGRSGLTLLGISVAILMMVVFAGFLDSFLGTLAQVEDALLYRAEDRLAVTLDFFYPTEAVAAELSALQTEDGAPALARVEPSLQLGGQLIPNEGDGIPVVMELLDFESALWVPNLESGSLEGAGVGSLVISQKAARDLGVEVGDRVTLEHPRREGESAFRLVEAPFTVAGIHDNPTRAFAYLDLSNAEAMGLAGLTNYVVADPTPGLEQDAVKQVVFTQPGVAAVTYLSDVAASFDRFLGLFVAFLGVISAVVAVMSFLIAFNTTSISVEERIREIATMLAFGLPIHQVTRMQMIENFVMGVLGTLLGIGLGWVVLYSFLRFQIEDQLAELNLLVQVAPTTLILALLIGILTVTLTPLLSMRRMARMDIPAELRVME